MGPPQVVTFSACFLWRAQRGDCGGTTDFMAPELWCGTGRLEPSADMWAVGVLTYMMLGGQKPFPKQRLRASGGGWMGQQSPPLPPLLFPVAQWKHVSPHAKDFCRRVAPPRWRCERGRRWTRRGREGAARARASHAQCAAWLRQKRCHHVCNSDAKCVLSVS